MPLPVAFWIGSALFTGGLGLGAFGGSQADDAIEVATGEKSSNGVLPLMLLGGGSLIAYGIFQRVTG